MAMTARQTMVMMALFSMIMMTRSVTMRGRLVFSISMIGEIVCCVDIIKAGRK